jgi:hypothetical protein
MANQVNIFVTGYTYPAAHSTGNACARVSGHANRKQIKGYKSNMVCCVSLFRNTRFKVDALNQTVNNKILLFSFIIRTEELHTHV